MTVGRTVLVVAVAAVGFVVGFYAGLLLLLSIVGLDDFRGWQFPLATVPTGSVIAGLAATAAAPGRAWLPVVTSSVAGMLATGIVYLTDGDFAVAILFGGAVAVVAATIAAVSRSSEQASERT